MASYFVQNSMFRYLGSSSPTEDSGVSTLPQVIGTHVAVQASIEHEVVSVSTASDVAQEIETAATESPLVIVASELSQEDSVDHNGENSPDKREEEDNVQQSTMDTVAEDTPPQREEPQTPAPIIMPPSPPKSFAEVVKRLAGDRPSTGTVSVSASSNTTAYSRGGNPMASASGAKDKPRNGPILPTSARPKYASGNTREHEGQDGGGKSGSTVKGRQSKSLFISLIGEDVTEDDLRQVPFLPLLSYIACFLHVFLSYVNFTDVFCVGLCLLRRH